jgi:hypothetical protein
MGHRSILIKFGTGFIALDQAKENPGQAGVFQFKSCDAISIGERVMD